MKNIFEFSHYKQFLIHLIESTPGGGRGLRSEFAKAARCQLPYVSHVLSGNSEFSSEQIDGIANFLKLAPDEHEFLLLLLQKARAGTISLEKFYDKKISALRSANRTVQNKIKPLAEINENDRSTYYSSWVYAAIHIMTGISEFEKLPRIAKKLNLPLTEIKKIILELEAMGLVSTAKGKIVRTKSDIHLGSDSRFIKQHHTNWRLQAISSLDFVEQEDLHYSLTFSISRNDLALIKDALLNAIEECAKIIRPSNDEELAVFCIDLFKLKP